MKVKLESMDSSRQCIHSKDENFTPERDFSNNNEVKFQSGDGNVHSYAYARAMHVLRNGNITYDTKFGIFIIKQPKEEARVVTLFPKTRCSCLSTGDCFHILAAKINLGMNIKRITATNLTILRKRTRSKKQKESKRFKVIEIPGMYSCN